MRRRGDGGREHRFDHLREHSIGLPQVLFQSITHMAPGAAVAYSIYISVPFAKQALALSVWLALIACLCAATAIGQLAKNYPSAGGLYTYAARSLGPWAGFFVAWLFIGFEPLVAPFLYLEFGWAMHDVLNSEAGWHWSGQWSIWVALMTVIVFLLTYRDVRISTTAGVILGAFEIAIFGALAIWILFSKRGELNVQPFNPHNALGHWSGVFKGMVFAILAFIGFEASAPLGEEAKNPRRTVPRAVIGSALAIGIFYVLCSYAWVFGAGFDNFVNQATGADPWRNLGKVFWGTGWVVVFLAICNSIAANSNAAINAATRVFYALAAQRARPATARARASAVQDAAHRDHRHERLRVHAVAARRLEVETPDRVLAHRDGRSDRRRRRVHARLRRRDLGLLGRAAGEFNPLLHLILPIGGIVLFFFPLYYQFFKFAAAVPVQVRELDRDRLDRRRRRAHDLARDGSTERLRDMDRVYVEDETITPQDAAALFPVA